MLINREINLLSLINLSVVHVLLYQLVSTYRLIRLKKFISKLKVLIIYQISYFLSIFNV